jgi:hypothetical protein
VAYPLDDELGPFSLCAWFRPGPKQVSGVSVNLAIENRFSLLVVSEYAPCWAICFCSTA